MQEAQENTDYFLCENQTGGAAQPTCLFRFSRNAENFTFDFQVQDGHLFCPYRKDNEPLYEGDAVEVFVSPDGNEKEYYELEVSPAGARFFACIQNDPDNGYATSLTLLPPAFSAETEQTKDGYRVRIVLPLKQLKGYRSELCRFNAYRLDYDGDGALRQLQALNPTLCDSFHRPAFFVRPQKTQKDTK